jgi:hypothetical protein
MTTVQVMALRGSLENLEMIAQSLITRIDDADEILDYRDRTGRDDGRRMTELRDRLRQMRDDADTIRVYLHNEMVGIDEKLPEVQP